MQDLESSINWFREEATKLPAPDRSAVMTVLRVRDPRSIFMGLDSLERQHRLPDSWREPLTEFYGMFC